MHQRGLLLMAHVVIAADICFRHFPPLRPSLISFQFSEDFETRKFGLNCAFVGVFGERPNQAFAL